MWTVPYRQCIIEKTKSANVIQCILLGTSLSPGTQLLMFLIALLSTGYTACFSFSLTTYCIPNFPEICISVLKLPNEIEIKNHPYYRKYNSTSSWNCLSYFFFFFISNSHHNFSGNKSWFQYIDLSGSPEEFEMHDKKRNPKQTRRNPENTKLLMEKEAFVLGRWK